jgi:hypothetical protein
MLPQRPQPERTSPCPPWLQDFNTESTEDLSALCVEVFFVATENTEKNRRRGWAMLSSVPIFGPTLLRK